MASLERARGGTVTAVVAGLNHYAIADTLGDSVPAEFADLRRNNEAVWEVSISDHVLLMPSLDCLMEVPASDPGFTAACLADADRWIAEGAVGFKDHAGKTFSGDETDLALWVGGFNRLAGWCQVQASDQPNAACLEQDSIRFPLSLDAYREVIREVVVEREKVWLTHAAPWDGSTNLCGSPDGLRPCFDVAVNALMDFADWAERELPVEARRRIVLAHQAFLLEDPRLERLLEAGFSIDLAQTELTGAGCAMRTLMARFPEQVVLGTDVYHGLDCVEHHYDPWVYALIGEPGEKARYRNTCRGTLEVVGAGLDRPDACGIPLPEGAGRAVLYDNAARLLQLDPITPPRE